MLKLEFAAPLAFGGAFLAGHLLNGAAPAQPAAPAAPTDPNSDPTLTGADTAGLDFTSLDNGAGTLNGVLPGSGDLTGSGSTGVASGGLPGGGSAATPPIGIVAGPGPVNVVPRRGASVRVIGPFQTYTVRGGKVVGHSARTAPTNTVISVDPATTIRFNGMVLVLVTSGSYAGLYVNPHGNLPLSLS